VNINFPSCSLVSKLFKKSSETKSIKYCLKFKKKDFYNKKEHDALVFFILKECSDIFLNLPLCCRDLIPGLLSKYLENMS
jgi:hypothetical protein